MAFYRQKGRSADGVVLLSDGIEPGVSGESTNANSGLVLAWPRGELGWSLVVASAQFWSSVYRPFSFLVRVQSEVGVLSEAGMMVVMPVWGPRQSALSATALWSIFVALVVLMFVGSALLIAMLS